MEGYVPYSSETYNTALAILPRLLKAVGNRHAASVHPGKRSSRNVEKYYFIRGHQARRDYISVCRQTHFVYHFYNLVFYGILHVFLAFPLEARSTASISRSVIMPTTSSR
jgi:hypothetical protein